MGCPGMDVTNGLSGVKYLKPVGKTAPMNSARR